jgi:hypothetical protein
LKKGEEWGKEMLLDEEAEVKKNKMKEQGEKI